MKINCLHLRDEIASEIKLDVEKLKSRGTIPSFAIIQVGNYPPSDTYVNVKMKKAKELGINVKLFKFPLDTPLNSLIPLISRLNSDLSIHGIILQRPLPPEYDEQKLQSLIDPHKDIDGLSPNSPFRNPLVAAVEHVINHVFSVGEGLTCLAGRRATLPGLPAFGWVGRVTNPPLRTTMQTVVVGKGRTAGKPIYDYFFSHPLISTTSHVIPAKAGILLDVKQIDSSTKNPDEILKKVDIIISCVGKPRIIRADNIKKGVVLISVGQHQSRCGGIISNFKFQISNFISKKQKMVWSGDYNEDEIKSIASAYTPTPHGIGPLNVIFLLSNVIKSVRI